MGYLHACQKPFGGPIDDIRPGTGGTHVRAPPFVTS